MANSQRGAPPVVGPEARKAEAWGGEPHRHSKPADVQTSRRLRRCPWFAEAIERAARPGAWHATAIVHAGAGAWNRAAATHQAGRRACTVLPLGTDPAAIRWPPVRFWIADAGDLPTADAIELARLLIDAGAVLVQMVGAHVRPSLTVRSARRGN